MEDNGNDPNVKIAAPPTPAAKRLRGSTPILIVAVLFVVGSFLAWYFTWFGRGLSDADISTYLADYQHPRHVQHALLQVQERIERKDPAAKRWYPQLLELSENSEPEFRLTVAWVMGSDNTSREFHNALKQLLEDPEPIVRRNAALALIRFNDSSGRPELVATLLPFEVKARAEGQLSSTLKEGAEVARGTLLGRITTSDGRTVEVRSPLPGKIEKIVTPGGSRINAETSILTIAADEDSIWEALRGLALVGQPEDLAIVERYAREASSERIRHQAAVTASAIRNRGIENKKASWTEVRV